MTELEAKKEQKEQGDSKELELDDLLIGGDEADEEIKNNDSKKIILLAAIGVLLFAIVILVVYMLQDSPSNESQIEGQKPLERVEWQRPNTQPQQSSQVNDFGQEPIQSREMQRVIDQINAKKAEQDRWNLPAIPEERPASAMPPVQKSKEMESPKRNATETFKNIKVVNPVLQGGEIPKGFYVQVGSFSKFSPSKQLVGAIESSGFSYRMQKAGQSNRLLIGPFVSRQDAQNRLGEIREKINKDAFIKEVK